MGAYQRQPPSDAGRWIHRVMLGLLAVMVSTLVVQSWPSRNESANDDVVIRFGPGGPHTTEVGGKVVCSLPWWYNLSSRHPAKIPDDWTHRELLDYLKGEGVEYV